MAEETLRRDRVRRRRWSAFAVLALIAAMAFGVSWIALGAGDDPPPLEYALALAADADGFDTGIEAGETLARVSQHLERAVAACRGEDLGLRCQALSAAFGYTQVLAARVLVCTAPGRYEARTRLTRYLDQVAAVGPTAERLPDPPPLPPCVH